MIEIGTVGPDKPTDTAKQLIINYRLLIIYVFDLSVSLFAKDDKMKYREGQLCRVDWPLNEREGVKVS